MAGQPQPLAGLQATGGDPTARRRRHRTAWKEAQALSVMSDCGAQARLDGYPNENGAAFIELKDDKMSGDELYQVLACVPGVDRVSWQTYKGAQGNHSQRNLGTPYMGVGHLLERKVFVKSKIFKREFEFELTRSMHTRTMGTCSMGFRQAPEGQLLEAWRILRHAVGDRGLPCLLYTSPSPRD